MLSFFCSVPWSSLVSKLLHHLITKLWHPSFVASMPLMELVRSGDRPIVESNVKSSDPPAQR
jgi:hypothetical protein